MTALTLDEASRPIAGVYSLLDPETGLTYVGQSRNILQRWFTHRAALEDGTHAYQHALGPAYRADRLQFVILARVPAAQLIAVERGWISNLCAEHPGTVVNCSGCTSCASRPAPAPEPTPTPAEYEPELPIDVWRTLLSGLNPNLPEDNARSVAALLEPLMKQRREQLES